MCAGVCACAYAFVCVRVCVCVAVLAARMAQHASAMVSYHTHPHLDLPETGASCAHILLQLLSEPPLALTQQVEPGGDVRELAQCVVRLPMLFSDCGTNVGELSRIFNDIAAWQEDGAAAGLCSLSLNMSFPSLDGPSQGWSVVAVAMTVGGEDAGRATPEKAPPLPDSIPLPVPIVSSTGTAIQLAATTFHTDSDIHSVLSSCISLLLRT